MKNIIKTVALGIVLSAGLWADSTPLFASVRGVAENDTLNVRTQANYKAKKVSELPVKAYVGVEKCKKIKQSTWCRVYPLVQNWYENFWEEKNIGWVNTRYLNFSDRGYVIINGKRNCAYALNCYKGKCEVVSDYNYTLDARSNIITLETKWIERKYLKGESSFGAAPKNADGYCTQGNRIDNYLKKQGK